MKKIEKTSPYPILSPHGRKGQSGEGFQNPPKSPLISGTGRKAFTLVELIIVITILAILATIAFMSFQGYMKQSRDAVRVSDLASASKGLSIFFTKSGVYPEVESGVLITASGNTLSNQGTLGESVVRAINMNQVPLDPVDQTKYTYSTNGTKTKYQLMSYTENASLASMMTQSYAQDLTDRGIQMQGDGLGIVLNTDNSLPTISSVDTYSGTETYKIVFDNDTVLEGSGNLVFSQIYNMRDDLLKNKELAKLDNAVVGYWDMETTTLSGSVKVLKDWSKYENNGQCYDGGTSVPCDGSLGGPQIINGDGKNGKMMHFDGNDWVKVLGNIYTDEMSIIIKITPQILEDSWHGFIGYQEPWTGKRSMNLWLTRTSILPNGGVTYWTNSLTSTGIGVENCQRNIKNNYSPEKGSSSFLLGFTRKGNTIKIHSNGNIITEDSCAYSEFYKPGEIWFGKVDNYLIGNIDEVRIYNRALSDSEIKALYNATK